jgi:hypothetical protein
MPDRADVLLALGQPVRIRVLPPIQSSLRSMRVMSQAQLENKARGYLRESIALGQRSCFLGAEGQIIRHEMDLAI